MIIEIQRTMGQSRTEKEGSMNALNNDAGAEIEIKGLKVSSIDRTAGGKIKVTWDDSKVRRSIRTSTPNIHDLRIIKEAIIDELSYFNEHVW